MSNKKSEFWWATVGGADCEPVEVTTLNNERVAYTCGCADPFYLDRPDCALVLVPLENEYDFDAKKDIPLPLERPLTPAQEQAQATAYEKKRKRDAKKGIHHGWRGAR